MQYQGIDGKIPIGSIRGITILSIQTKKGIFGTIKRAMGILKRPV
jgi:hypothetical protein